MKNTKNIIYGTHNIEFFIKKKPNFIIKSYVFLSKINKNITINNIIRKLKNINVPIYFVSKNHITNITNNNKNICIEVINNSNYSFNKEKIINSLNNENMFVILENIKDPRNLGACIRSADAAGIKTLIITKNNSSSINNTVRTCSSGSLDNLNIIKINDIKYILKFFKNKNVKIIATSNKSNNIIYNTKLKFPIVFIFGSEQSGITNTTKKYCDIIIKIPMCGYVNSLNISVSVGICLFETIRQNIYYKKI